MYYDKYCTHYNINIVYNIHICKTTSTETIYLLYDMYYIYICNNIIFTISIDTKY